MKKDIFIVELMKSFPFKLLVVLALLILLGVFISKSREKKVQMKEDVLYIQPKPKL
jgi:hypothetical protein